MNLDPDVELAYKKGSFTTLKDLAQIMRVPWESLETFLFGSVVAYEEATNVQRPRLLQDYGLRVVRRQSGERTYNFTWQGESPGPRPPFSVDLHVSREQVTVHSVAFDR